MSTGNLYQAVVIGAGINGLSTAYQLLKRGLTKVALIEQFSLGHSKGSSQGLSRITRSTYSSSKFVEIIQTAHQEDWPALERDLDQQLLHPRPGCFFWSRDPTIPRQPGSSSGGASLHRFDVTSGRPPGLPAFCLRG